MFGCDLQYAHTWWPWFSSLTLDTAQLLHFIYLNTRSNRPLNMLHSLHGHTHTHFFYVVPCFSFSLTSCLLEWMVLLLFPFLLSLHSSVWLSKDVVYILPRISLFDCFVNWFVLDVMSSLYMIDVIQINELIWESWAERVLSGQRRGCISFGWNIIWIDLSIYLRSIFLNVSVSNTLLLICVNPIKELA